MSNAILLPVLIVLSYLIFLLKNAGQVFKYASASKFGNKVSNMVLEKKGFKIYNGSKETNDAGGLNEFKIDSNIYLKTGPKKQPGFLDNKIVRTKKELNSQLKHLELILALESPLTILASKSKCTTKRLEEFIKIKKEVQLKIIELSQTISYYQSNKINLC
ncbi:hypothetical protein [Yeosuana sp.]|uniref:hypothetical protein n=1 Tax=Yeosuana sp. TaxID=2529388 RepID=UPI00405509B9|tara:strand:- start:3144 stop:3626 length:483 start_codon:yes stop_codon:yes gene_type:complete